MSSARHDRAYAQVRGGDPHDPGVFDAPGSYCIQCSAQAQDYVAYPCRGAQQPLTSNRSVTETVWTRTVDGEAQVAHVPEVRPGWVEIEAGLLHSMLGRDGWVRER